MALSEQIETTARTHQLGSDDDTSANEHAARASGLLVQVAGEVAEAGLAAARRGTSWATRSSPSSQVRPRRSRLDTAIPSGEGHHHLAGAARENGRRAGGTGAGHACPT